MHIIVWRRPGDAEENSLKQHHHKEDGEQFITLFCNDVVERGNLLGPVEVKFPAEEQIMPAGRDRGGNLGGGCVHHRHDGDKYRGESHKDILDNIGDGDAEHTAENNVYRSYTHKNHRVGVGGEMPGEENLGEFTHTPEIVSEEADDADQRENNDADIGEFRPQTIAEAGINPLRSRHNV